MDDDLPPLSRTNQCRGLPNHDKRRAPMMGDTHLVIPIIYFKPRPLKRAGELPGLQKGNSSCTGAR